MFPQKTSYPDTFFEDRKGALTSAKHIVPIVLELIHPKSVVDVGCGTGEFLYTFKEHGVGDILGIDGEWVSRKKLRISEAFFLSADVEKPLKVDKKFDLVVSLEVAEHLRESSARTFVETLTRLGPVILFSAAIPFQGGTHHVNEQWPEYWVNFFQERGYLPIDCIRKKIWNNTEVSFWYAQNTLLFVEGEYLKTNKRLKDEFTKTSDLVLSLVHPKQYLPQAKRYTRIMQLIPRPLLLLLDKLKDLLR